MGVYEDDKKWEDIVPIPQDEGGPNPLAAIAYTDEYSEAMSYLRAVMAKNEMSERALGLTEDIIAMNPAHYTVWLYRAQILKTLKKDPQEELTWLNAVALKHLKNYQIWHHRQIITSLLPTLPPTELPFLTRMLAKDVKNYHVWSYRQWLVKHFGLWDAEYNYIEGMLRSDVRNNSAWNHRWYVTFGRYEGVTEGEGEKEPSKEVYEREIGYAKVAIREAPQNPSPWNYLKGVLRKQGGGSGSIKEFALEFVDLDKEGGEGEGEGEGEDVRSSHALDFLAEIWAEEKQRARAEKALELLSRKYDPIRRNYWEYRRSLLEVEAVPRLQDLEL